MSSNPPTTGGKQLARAASHAMQEPRVTMPEPSRSAPSNAAVQSEVTGEEAGAGYLDGLFGMAADAGEDLGAWWSGDDTENVGPFAMEAPDMVKQIFGSPASTFSQVGTSLQAPTSHDADQQLDTPEASEVRHGLENGVISRQRTWQLGPATLGYTFAPTEGRLSGLFGFDAGSVQASTTGGVDFTDNGGLVEGFAGGVSGKAGDLSGAVGAGYRNTVTDVVEQDGQYAVTVVRGLGGKVAVGGGSGEDDVEGGTEQSASHAETVTRTFHSREDAEAFQASASSNPAGNEAGALQLKPGESLTSQRSDAVAKAAGGVAIAPMGAGLEKEKDASRTYTMGEDQVLSVTKTQQRTDGIKGSVGGALASAEGLAGYRMQQNEELTFDLKQPGVVGLLLAYQATGQLPEELPKGIERVAREDLSGPVKKSSAQAGLLSTQTERSLLTGTREEDGKVGGVARATYEQTAGYKVPLLGMPFGQGKESHELEVRRMPEEGVQISSSSRYDGRDSVASAVDDTERYLDLPELQQRYGDREEDIVVESDFGDGAFGALQTRALGGALENNEIDGARGFDTMKRQLQLGNTGEALARYVYESGGDALAALRDNTEGHRQDWVRVVGSELLGQTPEAQRSDQTEIDEAVRSGEPEELNALYAQEKAFWEALKENADQCPKEMVDSRRRWTNSNATKLLDAQDSE